MRVSVPNRRVKSYLRTLGIMTGIFAATIFVCAIVFAFFLYSSARLISPLVHLPGSMSSDNAIALIKDACHSANLVCSQVIALPDGSVQITLDSGIVAILSIQKDLKKQLASLQQVASQLTIKGKQLKRVDFRFARVVVSF